MISSDWLIPLWWWLRLGYGDQDSTIYPSVYWIVKWQAIERRYRGEPLYKTPTEVLYAGIDLSEALPSAGSIQSSTMSYSSGHGLIYDAIPTVVTRKIVGVWLRGGRRNTRHLLTATVLTSQGESMKIDCPVQVVQ